MLNIFFALVTVVPLLLAAGVIDVMTDNLLTFSQLSRRLPKRRGDRPVNVSTIHRWRHPGLHNVHLAAVRVGGCWCTTIEAYAQFVAELTRKFESSQSGSKPLDQSDQQDPQSISDALDKLGI